MRSCCCPRLDARDCFRTRYELDILDPDERAERYDDEECCCSCHHESDEDE